jgi:hypothetical protein
MLVWSHPHLARALFTGATGGGDVGAIEQDPMLPPRRYWQTFKTANAAKIASAWFIAQEQMGNCSIVSKAGDPIVVSDNFFVLWDVPPGRLMPWPQSELGFPQIADPQTATKRTDVDHSLPPDPLPLGSILGSAGQALGSAVDTAIVAGAVLLGVYILIRGIN